MEGQSGPPFVTVISCPAPDYSSNPAPQYQGPPPGEAYPPPVGASQQPPQSKPSVIIEHQQFYKQNKHAVVTSEAKSCSKCGVSLLP
jgi:hypothetical protein